MNPIKLNIMKQPIFDKTNCSCSGHEPDPLFCECEYCEEHENKNILYHAKLENLACEYIIDNHTKHLHMMLVDFYLKIKKIEDENKTFE